MSVDTLVGGLLVLMGGSFGFAIGRYMDDADMANDHLCRIGHTCTDLCVPLFVRHFDKQGMRVW